MPDELRGHDLSPVLADAAEPERAALRKAPVDLAPVAKHPAPARSVQDAIHFTYDDHQAATATQEAPGQPNRIRAIRTADAKYAFYFDPNGRAATEHELYDLERDPDETDNQLDVRTGKPHSRRRGQAARRARRAPRSGDGRVRDGDRVAAGFALAPGVVVQGSVD